MKQKTLVGSVERIALPDLGIEKLDVRVDTGAKTSSLHATNISLEGTVNKPLVKFTLLADDYGWDVDRVLQLPVIGTKTVISSNGMSEQRVMIASDLHIGSQRWSIHLTLTDRADMRYKMLLGRQAMKQRLIVDPSKKFLQEPPHSS